MDFDFIIREAEEETQRRRPAEFSLTGWETIVFEIADEDEEAEE